ncbi:MAG: helix-hairpin-helix domain-containing protein [Bacteroidaceae bacterium]|nr:helix-hairpin-helix domain-containing protein [Bacteroidaceae bacterium]
MMKQRLFIILLYTCLHIPLSFAQTEQEVERMSWEDFVEAMMDENDEGYGVDEELMEQLYELHGNPLDINEVRKEDLEVLPFLNEEQIEGIVRYVEKNRPVQSLGELMFVKELGKRGRELLRLFVEVKEGSSWHDDIRNMGKLLKYGKNEVVWRTDVPFYKKAGYEDVAAEVLEKSPNKVYRGDRFHHAFRYAFSSMNHLLAGLNMEKDAGEKGVDYVSGYVQVKDMGVVKNAIVGNYRLSFGKGLAVNTSAKFGKMMMFSSMDRMDVGIRKHSSTSEYGYFTGGAATLRFGQVEVSAFGSYRKNDGTYNSDSTGMSSLKTDGLHRTQLEHSKKGNLGTSNFGGNLHWASHGLQLSTTAIATHLSVPLAPKHDTPSSTYRLYNAHGQDFFVGSIAYAYRHQSLTFSGETAMSNNEHQNGTATLNSLRWRVNGDNVLTLVGRYYGAKFVSLNGKAFGENSAVQNEEGVFLSWTTQSLRNMMVEAYVDAMYFPWLKYQTSESSYGYEGMLQATYSPNSRWSLLARYRIKSKQKDFSYDAAERTFRTLKYNTNQSLKLQLNYTLSPSFSLRTSASGSLISFGANPNEKGFAIGENLRWQNPQTKLRIDLGIIYFNTDSYDSRIYNYEPSLLYSYASTSYYYQGIRTTLLASIPIIKQSLFINAKLGMTKYFDRESIGTGLEMINADHREDLQVQVRWKF